MILFHIPRPASNGESHATDRWYLKTALVRYLQPMNISPVPWSCHPPDSLREGEREREWTIVRPHQWIFPVFGLILCLRGTHEYSSKHMSYFFNKRNSEQNLSQLMFFWVKVWVWSVKTRQILIHGISTHLQQTLNLTENIARIANAVQVTLLFLLCICLCLCLSKVSQKSLKSVY